MFKKRQNKEVPIYHVLISNFIKYQAFNLTQNKYSKFLLEENLAQVKNILM